jgi:hypothetical protein
MLRSFALRRDPQPPVTPHCPTSTFGFRFAREVGQAGLHWTVEVEHVLETPWHPAAAGGKLFLHEQDAASNVAGTANNLRSAKSVPYSSPATRSAPAPRPKRIKSRANQKQ